MFVEIKVKQPQQSFENCAFGVKKAKLQRGKWPRQGDGWQPGSLPGQATALIPGVSSDAHIWASDSFIFSFSSKAWLEALELGRRKEP